MGSIDRSQIYSSFKKTQNQQIENEVSVELAIPSRGWSMLVWARSMEMGWDYQSVTYPYRMQFEVDEEFGQISHGIITQELLNLAEGIGWSAKYSGLDKNDGSVNTDPLAALNQYGGQSGAKK